MTEEAKKIGRYEKRLREDKERIERLSEENAALRQLLDCAAANISLLIKEAGGERKLSQKDVREALYKYRLYAERDEEGNYILKLCEESV
jgi:predicted RNase H-like nuclease (RuvC/YqgF family)